MGVYTIFVNRSAVPPIAVPFHQSQCHSIIRCHSISCSAIPPIAVSYHLSQCHSTKRSAIPPIAVPFHQSQCHSTNRSSISQIAVPFHKSQCYSTKRSVIPSVAVPFHQSQCHSTSLSAIPSVAVPSHQSQCHSTNRSAIPSVAVPFHQCFVPIFICTLLLLEGQRGRSGALPKAIWSNGQQGTFTLHSVSAVCKRQTDRQILAVSCCDPPSGTRRGEVDSGYRPPRVPVPGGMSHKANSYTVPNRVYRTWQFVAVSPKLAISTSDRPKLVSVTSLGGFHKYFL